MKDGTRTLAILIPSTVIAICFVLCPNDITQAVKQSLMTCGDTLIPSLLPFLVLSNFIMDSGIISAISKPLKKLTRFFFNLPNEAGGIILTSFIGGYPVGPQMIDTLCIRKIISEEQANKLMLFAINAGPAFIIGAVGFGMFGSTKIGIIIYISVILSAIITGIIVCKNLSYYENNINNLSMKSKFSIGSSISSAVKNGTSSMIAISAYFIVFSAVIEVINITCNKLAINPTLLGCILEVTKGCKIAIGTNLQTNLLIPLVSALISFGGFCVHCQISDNIRHINISYFKFLKSRILTAILAALISKTIMLLFPIDEYVFSNMATNISPDFSMSIFSCFATLLMAILLILDLDIRNEVC